MEKPPLYRLDAATGHVSLAAQERQPIDTAPMDGTLILGLDQNGWREMWFVRGGTDYGDYWTDHFDSEPSPTHWASIPTLPVE